MTIFEQNTKQFYEELKGDCNKNVLLQLAKKGIFLMEPLFKIENLKNEDIIIDISILLDNILW